MDTKAYFEGKKITVLGLGLLGRGVGDTKFLAQQGAELIVTDLKGAQELAPSLELLKDFPNITYRLEEHRIEDFQGRDYILKAAGVPDPSEYLDAARKEGTPIKMSASWFLELSGVQAIGITGTRGKSTTTHMIKAILEGAGIPVALGGNVRGVSTLALLETVMPEDVAVLELDSWQCQGFGEAGISPHVAVFTTFFPDHLNYYKNDMDAYLHDKAQIFLHQKPEDTLVLGAQCAELIKEKYGNDVQAHTVTVSDHDLRADWPLLVPGAHNRYNAALATEAARALSIDDEDIKEALGAFKGVPGRLELVREVRGIRIYNDNNSTTPEATLAALRAIGSKEEKRVVLIIGGDEKNLDMRELITEIPKWCKAVVLFKERGTDRIRDDVFALANDTLTVQEEEGLEACVRHAWSLCEEGDTLLYSPAFSSFGKYFKNEYDRGDQFNALIEAL